MVLHLDCTSLLQSTIPMSQTVQRTGTIPQRYSAVCWRVCRNCTVRRFLAPTMVLRLLLSVDWESSVPVISTDQQSSSMVHGRQLNNSPLDCESSVPVISSDQQSSGTVQGWRLNNEQLTSDCESSVPLISADQQSSGTVQACWLQQTTLCWTESPLRWTVGVIGTILCKSKVQAKWSTAGRL